MVAGVTVHFLPLARAHDLVGVELGGGARQDLGELHAELARHVVDGGNGHARARRLPALVALDVHLEVLGHLLGRHIAGLAQALHALANLPQLFCLLHHADCSCRLTMEPPGSHQPARRPFDFKVL